MLLFGLSGNVRVTFDEGFPLEGACEVKAMPLEEFLCLFSLEDLVAYYDGVEDTAAMLLEFAPDQEKVERPQDLTTQSPTVVLGLLLVTFALWADQLPINVLRALPLFADSTAYPRAEKVATALKWTAVPLTFADVVAKANNVDGDDGAVEGAVEVFGQFVCQDGPKSLLLRYVKSLFRRYPALSPGLDLESTLYIYIVCLCVCV